MARYLFYAVYEPNTGRVARSGGCQEADLHLQASKGQTVVAVDSLVDDEREYFPNGVRRNRPEMPLQINTPELDIEEILRIDGIPAGTLVIHPSGERVIDDGYLEWSSLTAGTFTFTFVNFPYQEVIVNAQVSTL